MLFLCYCVTICESVLRYVYVVRAELTRLLL